MNRLILTAAVVLSACTISEDAVPEALADAQCNYTQTCFKGAFDQSFPNYDACVSQLTGEGEVLAGSAKANNCTYSPENATACVAAWDRITGTCDPDTNLTECNGIWFCP